MREIVIDTETTGLDPLSGHRVVEIDAHSRRAGRSHSPSSALGKLRDICGNCPGLARRALPCGGTPAAALYIRLGPLRIHNGDGEGVF